MKWNSGLKMAGKYFIIALLSCVFSFQQLFAFVIWSDATQQNTIALSKQQSSFKQSDILKAENNFPFNALLLQTEDETEEDADENVTIQKNLQLTHYFASTDSNYELKLTSKLRHLDNAQLKKSTIPLFLLHQSWKHFLS